MARKEKKDTDWEGVEREYRAGQLSLSEIGALFNISKGRISQVATEQKWDRDLSAKIKAKAEAKLNDSLLNAQLNDEQKRSDVDRVEAGAEAVAKLILEHREDAAALRSKAKQYREELDECGDDVHKRTSTLKMLAEIESKIVAIEREAFNLGKDSNRSQSLGEFLESLS